MMIVSSGFIVIIIIIIITIIKSLLSAKNGLAKRKFKRATTVPKHLGSQRRYGKLLLSLASQP